MKVVAVIAFFSLQLSMFACGYTIHIHGPVGNQSSYFAQYHGPSSSGEHTGGDVDLACHIHASHVFLEKHPDALNVVSAYPDENYDLPTLNLIRVSIRIERPPKHMYS
jgi:hypothetical protein